MCLAKLCHQEHQQAEAESCTAYAALALNAHRVYGSKGAVMCTEKGQNPLPLVNHFGSTVSCFCAALYVWL